MHMHNQTDLMLEQVAKANIWLDTAETIAITDVKERCIAQAFEAEGWVKQWLRRSSCPEVEAAEVEEALDGLSDRLATQSFEEEERDW